jgi:hypothetical protein
LDLLGLFIQANFGFGVAKIVARQDRLGGNIDRVINLLQINAADDVK